MSDMLEEGPTEVSGISTETECPSEHGEQEAGINPCNSCGAQR